MECRKGKGAYAISDRVGPEGFVIGIDSSAANIENAIEYAPRSHQAKEDWSDYLAFSQGYFEDLRSAGIQDESIDVIIVNSVLNVAFDREAALREVYRVLAPEGYLYHANVFTMNPISAVLADGLRVDGNVFGAALTREAYVSLVERVGFEACCFSQALPVRPAGADAVETLKGHVFIDAVAQVVK